MNDQAAQEYGAVAAATETGWLTLSFVLIAVGVLLALFILLWGTRLAAKRRQARAELADRGELPVHDAPVPTPLAEVAPPNAAEPTPVPAPTPLADGPIAAAAPMEASPAMLAADAAAAPVPPPAAGDDLTRLKGVGPKLATRLGELGITSFAALAALDEDQARALDGQLGSFQGRMFRDRWIEQARFLAAGDTAGYEAVFGKL